MYYSRQQQWCQKYIIEDESFSVLQLFAPLILTAHPARQSAEPGADVGEGAEPEVLDRFAPHEPGIATA